VDDSQFKNSLATYCFTGPGVQYGSGHVHQVKCRTHGTSGGQAHSHAVGSLGACCQSCAEGKGCEGGLGADEFPTKTLVTLGLIAVVGIYFLPRVMGKMY
jgi:hypothetical protein